MTKQVEVAVQAALPVNVPTAAEYAAAKNWYKNYAGQWDAAKHEAMLIGMVNEAIESGKAECLNDFLAFSRSHKDASSIRDTFIINRVLGSAFEFGKKTKQYKVNANKKRLEALRATRVDGGVEAPAWMHKLRKALDAATQDAAEKKANRKAGEKKGLKESFEAVMVRFKANSEDDFRAAFESALASIKAS